MNFDVRYANHPDDSKRYDTAELRRHYHISNIFEKDSINLTYSHQDRIIAGGIMPVDEDSVLESCKELAAPYFLARRELGAINIGGDGVVVLDGVEYPVNHRDGIYVGMGTKELVFKSLDKANPAKSAHIWHLVTMEHPYTAGDDNRAVVQIVLIRNRHTDNRSHRQSQIHQVSQRLFGCLLQACLLNQIATRITRERQLRKYNDAHTALYRLLHLSSNRLGIASAVADTHQRCCRSNFYESVTLIIHCLSVFFIAFKHSMAFGLSPLMAYAISDC